MADIKLNISLTNGEKLSLGEKELLNLENSSQSTGQPKEIFYGVIPSQGSAEINDILGEIENSIIDGTIPNSNMPIQITANGKQVNSQITTDSDYDNTKKSFSIQFTDELSLWNDMIYKGYDLQTDDFGNPISNNAYNILNAVLAYAGYFPASIYGFVKYTFPSAMSFGNFNNIVVKSSGGWEITGFRLKTKINETYTIKLIYTVGDYSNLPDNPKYKGISFMALNDYPYNGDCQIIADNYIYLTERGSYCNATLEFTATTNDTYIVFNFGSAQDNQTINFRINSMTLASHPNLSIDNMLDAEIVYNDNTMIDTVKSYLENIIIPAPYIENGTLRDTIERFCTLAQLDVMQNDNGDIKFVSARPVRTGKEPVIVIPPKNQFSTLKKDVIIKNKYDSVELSAKKVKNEIDYDTIVTSQSITNFSNLSNSNLNENKESKKQSYIQTDIGDFLPEYRYDWYVAYAKGESKYYSIVLNIPKKQHFETILKIREKGTQSYTLTCDKVVKNATAIFTTAKNENEAIISNIQYGGIDESQNNAQIALNASISNEASLTAGGSKIATVELTDNSIVDIANLQELENEYIVNCNILVSTNFLALKGQGDTITEPLVTNVNVTGTYTEYIPRKLEISIYGDKRVISFEDLQQSYGSENNVVSLQGSCLTQVDAKTLYYPAEYSGFSDELSQTIAKGYAIVYLSYDFNNQTNEFTLLQSRDLQYVTLEEAYIAINDENIWISPPSNNTASKIAKIKNIQAMSTSDEIMVVKYVIDTIYKGKTDYINNQISQNILKDYSRGIETASVTVSCSDYFDKNGVQRKNWSNGDIFEVGDIVRLDKDDNGNSAFEYQDGSPKIWKVTGRKFRDGGCPYVDLELQESKTI